jgi:hypothetical protein
MLSKKVVWIGMAAAVAFLGGPLNAQDGRGTIRGRITDGSGAALVGAQIRVLNPENGATVSVTTNENGNYSVAYLLPGVYDLTVSFSGFKTTEKPGIEVRVNDILDVDLQLALGSATERVEVKAGTPLLETGNASLGEVVDQRRIEALPLQAGNANELVLIAPGVTNSTNLRQRKTSFNSASSQFTTNGNQLYSNEYTIDGVPDTFSNGGTQPLIAFQLPESAVGEFKVETSSFDASLGHTPGAVLNTVSRSGTNFYHGELHEWLINSALDADTFFQNLSGGTKPVYQDNRYGASVGGPVRIPKIYNGKNKTFFFYAWEANQWGKPTANVGSVPTDAEKNGDFSALLKLGSKYQIYDPLTTTLLPNGHYSRQPFKGNIIPPNRINLVAKAIQAYYAEPNSTGTADGQLNYTRNTKDTFDYYVHFVRIDHNFSERNRLFLRLNYDHYLESNSNFYNNIATGLKLTRTNHGAALDDVVLLSPSTILDLRYGLTHEQTPEQRRSSGFDLATLGFSPQLVALTNPKTATFPNVYMNAKALSKPSCTGSCTGTFSGFGNFQAGDGTITGLIHSWAPTVTQLRGNHGLHFGADLRLYRSFGFNGGYDVSPGFQFLPTYTNASDTAAAAPIGQEYAAFLLGIPAGQMARSASYATQNTYFAAFFHDDWRITPKLTLSVGLRYEYESPLSERFDRAVRGFDRIDTNPIAAQALANYVKNPIAQLPISQFEVRGGLMFSSPSNHSLWDGQKRNFLPRFGLAYQLNSNTVIRGGYGIFYDTIGVNRSPAIQTGFTATTPILASIDNGLHFIANTANPFPSGLLAAQGAAGGLATNLGQPLSAYPTTRLQPYAQRWSFGVQRLFAQQFVVEVGYVGNKAVRLPDDRNLNAVPNQYLSTLPVRDDATISALSKQVPNPFFGLASPYGRTIAVVDLLRPFPQFGDITETQPIGYSWYHSLQLRAERRFSHGYSLGFTYTWSKLMEATNFLNPADLLLARSIGQYDRPQRINFIAIFEVPIGRGRLIASGASRGRDALIGGWQLNSIVTFQSGAPLAFGDVIFNGDIRSIALPADKRSIYQWFNTSGFVTDPQKQRQFDIRTFPKYLPWVRGDGQSMWNLALSKSIFLKEPWQIQFRAECYDALNHVNFSDPDTTVTSSTFGRVSSQAGLSREFQFGLRLTF